MAATNESDSSPVQLMGSQIFPRRRCQPLPKSWKCGVLPMPGAPPMNIEAGSKLCRELPPCHTGQRMPCQFGNFNHHEPGTPPPHCKAPSELREFFSHGVKANEYGLLYNDGLVSLRLRRFQMAEDFYELAFNVNWEKFTNEGVSNKSTIPSNSPTKLILSREQDYNHRSTYSIRTYLHGLLRARNDTFTIQNKVLDATWGRAFVAENGANDKFTIEEVVELAREEVVKQGLGLLTGMGLGRIDIMISSDRLIGKYDMVAGFATSPLPMAGARESSNRNTKSLSRAFASLRSHLTINSPPIDMIISFACTECLGCIRDNNIMSWIKDFANFLLDNAKLPHRGCSRPTPGSAREWGSKTTGVNEGSRVFFWRQGGSPALFTKSVILAKAKSCLYTWGCSESPGEVHGNPEQNGLDGDVLGTARFTCGLFSIAGNICPGNSPFGFSTVIALIYIRNSVSSDCLDALDVYKMLAFPSLGSLARLQCLRRFLISALSNID
ncbi:uncharacterized protein BDR25DRAFT_360856 [Lindgomyces ingoldianus]|uniref:Uncharacterized protein n=1 Tax=Lindgomyces ingoldianus TaxID=673940 RepID=A0ACB6QF33_9PLEO|nr:uncharacterized protein BDR25DRAFT_360856 [Lindgomyces ingoldianus]KAF2465218.1 hypothetical protein BDR25DRAFT_360856 [Lindgomyces ingoldianus]